MRDLGRLCPELALAYETLLQDASPEGAKVFARKLYCSRLARVFRLAEAALSPSASDESAAMAVCTIVDLMGDMR